MKLFIIRTGYLHDIEELLVFAKSPQAAKDFAAANVASQKKNFKRDFKEEMQADPIHYETHLESFDIQINYIKNINPKEIISCPIREGVV